MKKFTVFFTISALVLTIGSTAFAALQPEDFAHGRVLEVEEDNTLHKIVLPAEVYSGLRQSDMSDLCVYNVHGEVVPFIIQTTKGGHSSYTESPAFFPLYGKKEEEVTYDFLLSTDGRRIRPERVRSSNATDVLHGYLLEARYDEEMSIFWASGGTLHFTPKSKETPVLEISISSSDNLEDWYPLTSGSLIWLRYKEQHLVRDTIDIPPHTKALCAHTV